MTYKPTKTVFNILTNKGVAYNDDIYNLVEVSLSSTGMIYVPAEYRCRHIIVMMSQKNRPDYEPPKERSEKEEIEHRCMIGGLSKKYRQNPLGSGCRSYKYSNKRGYT